jgi:hypothetical protein
VAIDEIRCHFLISLLFVSLGVMTACRPPDLTGRTEEEPPQLSTEVQVADSSASAQLLSGWYSVERNSWRWTARKFTVVLRPPVGSAANGATLNFSFTVPDVVITRLHSVTLCAFIQTTRLAPETYQTSGKMTYIRDVPAGLLFGETVRVDFELNRAMFPGQGDTRELGVIADRVGLETK